MKILGIDPGYAIIGYGVLEYRNNHFTVVDYGAITTDAGVPFNRRLEIIFDELSALLEKHRPDAMSVEKVFYNNNAKTVIDVSQARGVIMLAAQKARVPVFEYTPLQVKQSVVGYGRAEKKQIQEMTRRILNLDEVPKPDDTADALAMAICHGHTGASQLGAGRTLRIREGI
ncbi:MAG: crossover junction endodeoxyribonuclease RuvC [Clostridia bacterium]|nr:crossover junction endodeoxyribonuclease RuvC [Clostridia bacterium]